MIRDLRQSINESPNYDIKSISRYDIFQPVVFSTEGRILLSNLSHFLSKGYLAINPKFDIVLTALRTAWSEEWKLDKDITVANDTLDSLRLSCKGYNILIEDLELLNSSILK